MLRFVTKNGKLGVIYNLEDPHLYGPLYGGWFDIWNQDDLRNSEEAESYPQYLLKHPHAPTQSEAMDIQALTYEICEGSFLNEENEAKNDWINYSWDVTKRTIEWNKWIVLGVCAFPRDKNKGKEGALIMLEDKNGRRFWDHIPRGFISDWLLELGCPTLALKIEAENAKEEG